MFSASKSKGASSGYQIANSLRFRSSASAYLNRTPASAGNRQTWTWSGWVKRGVLGGGPYQLFAARTGASATYTLIYINNDNLIFADSGGAGLISTAVYRDPSSWYHIICAVDTTQATASNRVRMYVNGAQVTSFSTATYPTQNSLTNVNSTAVFSIGRQDVGIQYFDGYMAEVNFIDGQALTPSAFGMFDAASGVWKPTVYGGTYGTNGFKLNFSNGTSTTTLGYDSSGNSNNWTTNNISLTAGSTYDWMIDSPTNYDNGGNGVGNYAVLNPLNENISGLSVTLSNGNLTASGSTYGAQVYSCSMQVPLSGKWYYENSYSTIATIVVIGIRSYSTGSTDVQYRSDGQKTVGGTTSSYGASWTTGDIIGIAIDRDAGAVTFYKNGSSQGAISIPTNSAVFDMAWNQAAPYGSTTFSVTYGQRPFAFSVPSGYKTLCTQNLPAPTIYNGAQYMAATTYTGTGSSLSISNSVNSASFQPDFVWIKSRSAATDHALYDVIRGTQNRLESNTTDAAVAADNGLTAFGSSGFTVNTLAQVNTNAATYVGWQWKAGGAAVTNTNGSITSSVSASTLSGFSVVTYTGSGANATVGHGLGVAPSMVICKRRSGVGNWIVYHASIGATKALWLNDTVSVQTTSAYWNDTAPTSSVFTVSNGGDVNNSGTPLVAYCFAAIAGYSAFGSYTGNGSADGPFVYCGFRPRFVMVKRTDAVDSWGMFDSSRDAYNAENALLRAESSNAEASMTSLVGNPFGDFLSNGFKVRNSSTLDNASGGTYIYAAFAENPFQNSLAR